MPVALDDVLERAQLAQADRAAGVQLLRRVADLGAHPELAAVGEARRGVDVDAGGVDAELERARGGRVASVTIASEWPRAVAVDVLDRLLDGVDDAHREDQREELGVPVRLGRAASDRHASPASARVRSSTRSSTPAVAQRAQRARQERRRRRRACTSSVSAALQTPGRWILALRMIASAASRSARRRRRRGSCPRRRRSPARSRRPSAPSSAPRRRAG